MYLYLPYKSVYKHWVFHMLVTQKYIKNEEEEFKRKCVVAWLSLYSNTQRTLTLRPTVLGKAKRHCALLFPKEKITTQTN